MKPLGDWQKIGIVRVNGEPFPRPGDKASLFAPEGASGPAFLVLNNFRSILHYNVAKSYALGRRASVRPAEGLRTVRASMADRRDASVASTSAWSCRSCSIAQGLMTGEPDGVIGPATLDAVKTYQRAKGLGVDGFPSLTILKLLRNEPPPVNVGAVQPAAGGRSATPGVNAAAPAAPAAKPAPGAPGQPADAGQ